MIPESDARLIVVPILTLGILIQALLEFVEENAVCFDLQCQHVTH